jgi:hypothetical protein
MGQFLREIQVAYGVERPWETSSAVGCGRSDDTRNAVEEVGGRLIAVDWRASFPSTRANPVDKSGPWLKLVSMLTRDATFAETRNDTRGCQQGCESRLGREAACSKSVKRRRRSLARCASQEAPVHKL